MDFVKKNIRLCAFLAFALLILILNSVFGWTAALENPESLPALRQALREDMFKALILYIAITVAGCVVLALPGVVFAVAAGVLFGPLLGTAACSVATTLGACIAFLAGRYFLRDTIKPIVMNNKYIRRFFFDGNGRNDLFLLALTRLLPIFPYNLQNFAYGITDIGFSTYTLYSFVFMLPGTAAYVIAAAGISNSQNRLLYLVVAAALLAAVAAASFLLKKRGLKGQVKEDET